MSAAASNRLRASIAFAVMAALLLLVGIGQSWSLALAIFNLCLISAIMSLGVNIQWGYAGLFNVGIMGFAALGGVAAVLVSKAPVAGAWAAGGGGLLLAAACGIATIAGAVLLRRRLPKGKLRLVCMGVLIALGYFAVRYFYDPAVAAIEAVNPAKHGYLGGLGLPVIVSWAVGGLFAAGAAWVVGKVALGLRSDYLAIATLGISEIIIAFLKNEDWLTRGVKNVTGLARPVPYEIDLQQTPWFIDAVEKLNAAELVSLAAGARLDALNKLVIDYSSLLVKLCYTGLFAGVLVIILLLSSAALNSPWGRMMRAIRDNEVSANAMGKNITARHRQVFILGSAVIGIGGAMLTTLDGQFTPGTYHPLRFTFLIWVMVIVGGSGNNLGAVLGGFLVWFFWIEAEPAGLWLIDNATNWLGEDHAVRIHLMNSAQHMRLFLMGLVLLLVMRFSPGGILPEVVRRR
ncbi:branched-chain amino acid ABC transporter permease [Candidatus Spongiihabitans sp.]|uniref:branched-chain amino acid ABC transporter permease n=1 Tax=Candidatus Spongiihabitans sp. TaxID=3101308 RepID=UPI003C6FFF90